MGIIVYGLNDISDIESDKLNHRKGTVEGAILSRKQVSSMNIIVAFTSIGSLLPYFFTNHLISTVPILLIVLFAYIYSIKPFRLKSRPLLDSFSNAIWMLLVFLLGFSLPSSSITDLFRFSKNIWLLVLGVFAVHALTTLLDYDVDKSVHDKTTGIYFGIAKTSYITCIAFVFILFLLKPFSVFFTIYLSTCAILCILASMKPTKKMLHKIVWIILLGFPLASALVLIYEKSFIAGFLGT